MKYLKIVIIVCGIVFAIMFLNFLNQKRDQNFWNWFSKNDIQVFSIVSGKESIAEELSIELKKVNENLVWSIGGSPSDNKRDFIISAAGIKSSFPDVVSLYNSAPKDLVHWNFIAFRPKTNTERIQFEDKVRDLSDFYFRFEKYLNKYNIDIYVKNYESGVDDHITYLFLDSLLGEYNVETKLAAIDIHNLNTTEESRDLFPLKKIADYIEI